MKKLSLFALIAICISSFGIMSCHKEHVPTKTLTLYDSLGGTTMVQDPNNPSQMIEKGRLGIRSVVDSTIFVIAADPSINTTYFATLLSEVGARNFTGFEELSKNLTDFFCVATGSKNYTYTGLSMTVAHNPGKDALVANPRISQKVDAAGFNEFIVDLGKGATKVGLPNYLIARVAAVASSVQGQVVQR